MEHFHFFFNLPYFKGHMDDLYYNQSEKRRVGNFKFFISTYALALDKELRTGSISPIEKKYATRISYSNFKCMVLLRFSY